MSDYSNKVRRTDRQETDISFLRSMLNDSVSCSIAVEKKGFPLIHVAFHVYDEINNEIIFHFSKHGHAGNEITNDKKVCVSLYKYGKLYTAAKAVDFGCEYQSVIIYGTIKIIENESERLRDMDIFFNKFFPDIPKENYEAFTSAQAKPIFVARIKIDDWLAKEHRVPEKALLAFYPPNSPII